jgi:hypothetical protein
VQQVDLIDSFCAETARVAIVPGLQHAAPHIGGTPPEEGVDAVTLDQRSSVVPHIVLKTLTRRRSPTSMRTYVQQARVPCQPTPQRL